MKQNYLNKTSCIHCSNEVDRIFTLSTNNDSTHLFEIKCDSNPVILSTLSNARALPPRLASIYSILYRVTVHLHPGVTHPALNPVLRAALHMLHQLAEALGLELATGGVGGDGGLGGKVEDEGEQSTNCTAAF